MNPITFNDRFKEFLVYRVKEDPKGPWSKALREMEAAPLFVYDFRHAPADPDNTITGDEAIDKYYASMRAKRPDLLDPEGRYKSPFGFLRLAIRRKSNRAEAYLISFGARGTCDVLQYTDVPAVKDFYFVLYRFQATASGQVSRGCQYFQAKRPYRLVPAEKRNPRALYLGSEGDHPLTIEIAKDEKERECIAGMLARGINSKNGLIAEANRLDGEAVNIRNQARSLLTKVTLIIAEDFLHDLNNPANFIAASHPPDEGRSVEWRQARTIHTIIDKKHPANDPTLRIGAVVTDTEDAQRKRAAGHRRAHDRVLRSPFYRHKQGQTIRVRATWCGPKEWKDALTGHTYRVLA